MKRRIVKYDWVPHEVKREYTENVVAYVLVAIVVVAVPLVILIAALK